MKKIYFKCNDTDRVKQIRPYFPWYGNFSSLQIFDFTCKYHEESQFDKPINYNCIILLNLYLSLDHHSPSPFWLPIMSTDYMYMRHKLLFLIFEFQSKSSTVFLYLDSLISNDLEYPSRVASDFSQNIGDFCSVTAIFLVSDQFH